MEQYNKQKLSINNISSNNDLLDKIDNIEEAWDFMTIEERQSIVRCLVSRVIITDNKVKVVLNM